MFTLKKKVFYLKKYIRLYFILNTHNDALQIMN